MSGFSKIASASEEALEEANARVLDQFARGGKWLATVRLWIHRRFSNGDCILWGSQEPLGNTDLTPSDLEELAEAIMQATISEYIHTLETEVKR
jgi:hypothetical protein